MYVISNSCEQVSCGETNMNTSNTVTAEVYDDFYQSSLYEYTGYDLLGCSYSHSRCGNNIHLVL